MENLAASLGASTDPDLRSLGTRLRDTLIVYRRAATGVQFSQKEERDYEKMMPNYKNLPSVNKAIIKGLLDSNENQLKTYWERKIGPDGSKWLLGDGTPTSTSSAPIETTPKGKYTIVEVK
jgi:hypothetical protein